MSYNPTGGGGAAWGSVTGTLSSQTDLQTALDAKQATLVSATNIKTINGSTVLGSGDLVVSATAADISLNLIAPSIDETITAGYAAICSNSYYEIADTKFLELGSGSTFEIS